MNVAIIKYNAGNIQSVLFALERIGCNAIISGNSEEIAKADKVIFPGVGEASTAMKYLKDNNLDKLIISLKQPVLGICLGMQLLCNYSAENSTICLGIYDDVFINKFTSNANTFKIPQMGWNKIYNLKSRLLSNIIENEFCYFVHSYYAGPSKYTIAETNFIKPYSSALKKDNFYGVQFHPEKSAETGEQILKNFLAL